MVVPVWGSSESTSASNRTRMAAAPNSPDIASTTTRVKARCRYAVATTHVTRAGTVNRRSRTIPPKSCYARPLAMHILLLRPVPGNERFGLGPFFRIEPLGMEYIAAALEASGHRVTLVDLRFGRSLEYHVSRV